MPRAWPDAQSVWGGTYHNDRPSASCLSLLELGEGRKIGEEIRQGCCHQQAVGQYWGKGSCRRNTKRCQELEVSRVSAPSSKVRQAVRALCTAVRC
jgi:hypothetical protein